MSTTPRSVGLLAWFAGNHVAANILMIALVVAGAYTVGTMRTEVFPQIDPRTISVSVPYSGANPEEVESGITIRVESALSGISGIERITSTASEGVGTVAAELTSFADADEVLADVRDAVDGIADFPPEGAEDPIIEKSTIEPRLLTLALYGDASERQLRQTAERLRDELLATNRLADVVLDGVRAYEISIEVSEDALQRYNLTFESIAQRISAASLDLAGGTLRTANGEILLRTPAKRTTAEGFGEIPILVEADGAMVRLADISTIRDGFADGDLINVFNGEPSVFISVYRSVEQGVLDAEAVVRAYLEDVSVPPGMNLIIRDNDTDGLRDRINLMLRNAIFGFGLVFLSLVMFLDLKLAFWTSLAIPISFLGGLAIAGYLGASINMISLFALIIVLGIVVDDAVVIGENIFESQSKGGDPLQATLRGLYEVAAPVTLGVLTTIIAFAPLAFTAGRLGQVISVVPIVVISILAISLIEGLFILPAHLSRGGRWSVGPLKWLQTGFAALLAGFIRYVVRPAVRLAVTFRYATLALVTCAIVLSATAFTTGFLRFVFLPPTEADRVELTLTMIEGAPFATTRQAAEAALVAAERVNDEVAARDGRAPVLTTSATIGEASSGGPGGGSSDSGSNVAQIRVELTPSDSREIGSVAFEQLWRDEIGALAGADSMIFASGLFVLGDDVSVELSHPSDDQLLRAAEAIRTRLGATSGVSDIEFSLQFGKRQLEFQLNDVGIALGLSDGDLARQIRRAFFGETVQTLQRGLEEVDVVVRYPSDARTSLSDVYDMRIRLPGGEAVPVTAVADITESRGFSTIERADGRRILRITAKVDSDVTTSDNVNNDLRRVFLPQLVDRYAGLSWSMSGQAVDQQRDVQNVLGALGIAMLGIFVMMAAFTRSYILPLVILTTIAYGIVGAILGHVALGYPLTFISLFGVVALAGVVVNDTILLLDDYTRRMARDPALSKANAIVESASRRFRPILMTTISTAFGLLPMIYETSFQAKFLIPMAISLGFGILIATPVLLVAVPATVLILDDLGRPFRWARLHLFPGRSAIAPAE
ncbi:MAG: efflux RND transporter permease subunit [Rhodobacter sp.]|nr:efflux RND transporter permease subunit [Rhodobacter sp.]